MKAALMREYHRPLELWELMQLHASGRVRLETETHSLDTVPA